MCLCFMKSVRNTNNFFWVGKKNYEYYLQRLGLTYIFLLFKRKITMLSGIFLEGLKDLFFLKFIRTCDSDYMKYMTKKNYLGYILGCPIITYRLIVIANTVNNDTAKRPYLRNGNKRHNNSP